MDFSTTELNIVKKRLKDEIKRLGITISDSILEDVFYQHFDLERAWTQVLDKSLGKKLPSDQLDKLKQLKTTTEDLTMNIISESQNQTKVSENYSSLEEKMIVEEDQIASDKENPGANDDQISMESFEKNLEVSDEKAPAASDEKVPVASVEKNLKASKASDEKAPVASSEDDGVSLLIQELNREKTNVESLLSIENLPTEQDLKEIAQFCDKLTSAEQNRGPKQPERKKISADFVTQIINFAQSLLSDVIEEQFLEPQMSGYMDAFEIIENPFKILADLRNIPKVSNSVSFKRIFLGAVATIKEKINNSQKAALKIISNFHLNGSNRENNIAITDHLTLLEKAKWIDNYMAPQSCQQFSSEIKKEIYDCVEKFTKSLKKIDLNDEKNKWMDEISVIESKVNQLPLKPLVVVDNSDDVFTKFSKQVQEMKASFFANIMKEFPSESLKKMEPISFNISKAVTTLEGLRKFEDCDQRAKNHLEAYLKGYFSQVMNCFQQLKVDMNRQNNLKNPLEECLGSIKKNSKIAAVYLDNLKLIKDKYSVLHAFLPKQEEIDSFLSDMRNFRKILAREVERGCNQTSLIITFHSKLQIIESLIGLDGYISGDGESFSQLHKKHSPSYEDQIKKHFNNARLDLKNDKIESVVSAMKGLEHTFPQYFETLGVELENYIDDLMETIKREAASLSPSSLDEQQERIENGLKILQKAKTYIPKEYLPKSYNKIVDCISSVEEERRKKFSSFFDDSEVFFSQSANNVEDNVARVIRKTNELPWEDAHLNLNTIKFEQFTPKITKAIENRRGLLGLYLNNCALITLEWFPKLPQLVVCELANNNIEGSELFHLKHLTQLQSLSLGGNPISEIKDLEHLKSLKDLTTLNLYDCPISQRIEYRKRVFAMFSELQELDNMKKDSSDKEGKGDDDFLRKLEELDKTPFKTRDKHYGEKISYKQEEGRKKLNKGVDDIRDYCHDYQNFSDDEFS